MVSSNRRRSSKRVNCCRGRRCRRLHSCATSTCRKCGSSHATSITQLAACRRSAGHSLARRHAFTRPFARPPAHSPPPLPTARSYPPSRPPARLPARLQARSRSPPYFPTSLFSHRPVCPPTCSPAHPSAHPTTCLAKLLSDRQPFYAQRTALLRSCFPCFPHGSMLLRTTTQYAAFLAPRPVCAVSVCCFACAPPSLCSFTHSTCAAIPRVHPHLQAKRGYLRDLKPGDVVRPQDHPPHVDLSLKVPNPRYPGWKPAKEMYEANQARQAEELAKARES